MKILLVHNFYGSTAPSGENRVFEAERKMLETHGETVDIFTRHSDEIRNGSIRGLIKGAFCTVGNPFAARALARKIREFKPDVVHFHNQFPLISPLAIRAAHGSGSKVVMTLHNYRIVCAAGVPMRCGKVCTECFRHVEYADFEPCRGGEVKKEGGGSISTRSLCSTRLSIMPAIRHRCYRGSLLATIPLAITICLYRTFWAKWVDRLIVLSEFQKARMIECNFPAEKIVVKGNFIGHVERNEHVEKENQIVYVGRLSDEKGVRTLIEAVRLLLTPNSKPDTLNFTLLIIGDGEKRAEYEKLAEGLPIRFLGQLNHNEVVREVAHARCLVLPSECWETFGLVVIEAALAGTPSVVSDLGALPSMIGDTGIVVKAGDAQALDEGIRSMLTRADYDEMCNAAKRCAEVCYSEGSNYRQLMEIYAQCADSK
jgi:glycosyltransferase involved in cell wall biosynthesis